MTRRHDQRHIDTWYSEGGLVIERFFTPAEVAAVCRDFERVFPAPGSAGDPVDTKSDGEVGRFNAAQFRLIQPVPMDCSPALNLIGVHPAMIALARDLLASDHVQVYQCQAWAKFTGEADYDQPFHCDFANHTLTVPSEETARNSVTILCYFTDVTEAHGATHYVPRSASAEIAPPEATLITDPDRQAALQGALKRQARSAASPAGSIFPYSIDVWHRGTNMTAPGGCRYALMACFKAAGDEAIGFHAWPVTHTRPWQNIFNHASPEQLACFGVPRPGHPFWTPTTLAGAQLRYPGWNLSPYRDAAG